MMDTSPPTGAALGLAAPAESAKGVQTHPAGTGGLLPWQWALLAACLLIWIVVPALVSPGFPLDVTEGIAWGRQWQWGYYKHPSLPPWLVYASFTLSGKVGPYLLSALCLLLTLWWVHRLGVALLDRRRAALGTLALLGVFYYGWPLLEFNHNVAQLPAWAAMGWFGWRAMAHDRLRDWLWLGLWCGLGMLTKYSAAMMIATLLLILLAGPQRRLLARAGPWLCAGVALLVFAPHLLWLMRHDWLPLVYARQRGAMLHQPPLPATGLFALTQLLAHLPLLLGVVLSGAWRHVRQGWRTAFATTTGMHGDSGYAAATSDPRAPLPDPRRYLLGIALLPTALTCALGATGALGLHDMWGLPMWNFSGLLLAALLPTPHGQRWHRRLVRTLLVWVVLLTVLMTTYLALGQRLRHRPARMDWPARALAQASDRTWDGLSTCPLDVVAGDYWLAGLATLYARSSPAMLIAGDRRYSPWISAARVREHGALWLRTERDPSSPPALIDDALHAPGLIPYRGEWQLGWPRDPQAAPLVVQWQAWVPERCVRPSPQ